MISFAFITLFYFQSRRKKTLTQISSIQLWWFRSIDTRNLSFFHAIVLFQWCNKIYWRLLADVPNRILNIERDFNEKRRWKVKKIRAQLWFEMQLLLMRARAKKKRTHNNWTLQPPQRTASFFSQSVLFDVYFCDSNNSVKGQHTKTSYLRHHHHHQHRQTQNVYNNLRPLERAPLSTILNCIWFMWILHFLNDKQQQQNRKYIKK